MDSDDKKIKSIMVETLKEIVVPRLDKIEKKQEDHDKRFTRIDEKLDATMEMVAKNSEDITTLNIDVKEIQEDVSDANFTSQRIESKLNTVMKDQDAQDRKTAQLNRRVLRLEAKKS